MKQAIFNIFVLIFAIIVVTEIRDCRIRQKEVRMELTKMHCKIEEVKADEVRYRTFIDTIAECSKTW